MRESQFDRLVRSIRVRAGGRYSAARLRLDPPELGRVQVDIRMDGDRLRVSVHTQTEEARAVLSRRAAELRAALAESGIQVSRFDVVADMPANEPVDVARWKGSGSPGDDAVRGRRGDRAARADVTAPDGRAEVAEEGDEPTTRAGTDARLDVRV